MIHNFVLFLFFLQKDKLGQKNKVTEVKVETASFTTVPV